MRRITLVLAAAVGLAVVVQCASASTFTVMEPPYRATWRSLRFSGAGASVSCAVTLEGSFASATISKTAGARIGTVNRANVTACSGGTVTVLPEGLPWSVQYSSFAGTLPNITSVTTRLVGAAFRVRPTELLECLARSEASHPLPVTLQRNEGNGVVTGVRVDETATIPLTGGFGCSFYSGSVSGTGGVTLAGQRAELEILLREQGVSLVEAVEGPPHWPIELDIPVGSVEGTKGISSQEAWRDATIYGAAVIGENQEKYRLVDEPNACRTGYVLLTDGNNICNAQVALREGAPRGYRSTVSITYRYSYWIFFTATVNQQFRVIARA